MTTYRKNGIKSTIKRLVGDLDLWVQLDTSGSAIIYFGNHENPKKPIYPTEDNTLAFLSFLVPEENLLPGRYPFQCTYGKFPEVEGQLILGKRYVPVMGLVQRPQL